ncbi:MAG: hypothetical protein AB7P02_23385 [Alphaproteobacteria bacterium]
MDKVLDFLKARLKERSTWIGLTTLLTAVGVSLSPEAVEAIAAAGVAVAGAVFVLFPDKPKEPAAG